MASPSSAPAATRLALAYAALFGWMGVYLPYWPVWLADRGMSSTQIGILLAMAPWTRVLANPLAGQWADRHGRPDLLVRRLSVLVALILAGFLLADGFVALLLAMIATGLVFGPIIPLTDGITVGAEAQGMLRYGPVRLWGSVAFIATSWVGGELLGRHGEPVILWLLMGLAATIALTAWRLPRSSAPHTGSDHASPWSSTFVAVLVLASLLHAGHAVLYAFGTQHWLAHGHSEGTVGLLWAEGVIAEIILFALAPRIERWLTPRRYWVLAGLAGVVRWCLLARTTALPWLIAGQALHAFTFAALHLGVMDFIRTRIPAGARSRATTSYAAIASGLALGLALPLAGVLYEQFAGDAYWVMAFFSGAGLLVALGLPRQAQQSPVSSAWQPTSNASFTDSVTGPHASSPHTAKST